METQNSVPNSAEHRDFREHHHHIARNNSKHGVNVNKFLKNMSVKTVNSSETAPSRHVNIVYGKDQYI